MTDTVPPVMMLSQYYMTQAQADAACNCTVKMVPAEGQCGTTHCPLNGCCFKGVKETPSQCSPLLLRPGCIGQVSCKTPAIYVCG